tara:strand:- start:63 stop:182 length:120 start_codon:yes stop_codon:yes gene_type:complete
MVCYSFQFVHEMGGHEYRLSLLLNDVDDAFEKILTDDVI